MQHQTQTRSQNPPLPFTREAIIGHYQHHATNGPAYVQIQATNALARIMGLFKQGKDAVQDALHSTVDKTKSRFYGLKFDGYGAYDKGDPKSDEQTDEDDEEAASKEEDDVPYSPDPVAGHWSDQLPHGPQFFSNPTPAPAAQHRAPSRPQSWSHLD